MPAVTPGTHLQLHLEHTCSYIWNNSQHQRQSHVCVCVLLMICVLSRCVSGGDGGGVPGRHHCQTGQLSTVCYQGDEQICCWCHRQSQEERCHHHTRLFIILPFNLDQVDLTQEYQECTDCGPGLPVHRYGLQPPHLSMGGAVTNRYWNTPTYLEAS